MVNLNQMLLEKKADGSDIKCFIIYHKSDTDGKGSGGLLRYYAEKILTHDPIMVPYDYGDSLSWFNDIEEHDIVFMGDVSLPLENMNWLTLNTDFSWYDHHISAINAMRDIGNQIKGHREMSMSAIGIIYEHLIKTRISEVNPRADKIIELISDYDNWNDKKYGKDEYKRTPMAFSMFMNSVNIDPATSDGYTRWVELLEKGTIDKLSLEEMIDKGRYIQAFQDKKNAGTVKNNAFEIEFEGLNAIACFGVNGSNAFDSVYDENKHDIMVSISVTNRKDYSVSLYTTKDDVDVSLIAKKFGGGGHKGASGFNCDRIDFKNETLIVK